jgi:DNA (cytosine-5)-methyltransferase 1
MRFLDLFAGIGGFRLALERAGHTCVGFCEIDKFARQTYKANFDTEGEVEWHDITAVTDEDVRQLGSVDIITGGFPCQAFSVAGKRGGFNDTRGTLFFEIARIARILKPRYLLLENVKGLLNHSGGTTFATILNTLGELGYWWEYQVLNSKDFGVPQNRERVFIIGHSRRFPRREIFPITRSSGQALRQLVGGTQGYRVYDPAGVSVTLASQAGGMGAKTGLYAIPVLTPDRAEKRQNGRRFKEPGEPMFTLTAQDRHGVLISQRTGIKEVEVGCTLDANYHKGLGSNQQRTGVLEKPPHILGPEDINNTVRAGGRRSLSAKHNHDTIYDGVRIRRLTPLECFRLQGFPDEHFHNAKAAGVSDSQLYKQAGNAVTVNVVYEIARRFQND